MINQDADNSLKIILQAQNTLELARKSHEKYLLQGQMCDLDSAVNYYIDVIKNSPTLSEPYYRLASLMWQKGEINLETAIEQCKSAINLSPDNPNARIYTGYFLELAKQYDEAEVEFKEAIKINPLNSSRPRISLATMLIDKMQAKEPTAKDVAQALYYIVSGSATMVFDRNTIRMLTSNLNKIFTVAGFKLMGKVFEKTNNVDMALKTYDKAAKETCRSDVFYKKIGDINIQNESPEIALDSYKKALINSPYDKELLYKVATISQIYFENEVNLAIDCYTKLLEIEADKEKIYYELGHLYLNQKDFINSINAFNLALEYDVDNPFYHNALAYALVEAEQYEEAIEHYQIAININPNPEWTSIVCQALGTLQYRIFDNLSAATALYQSAILLDPNSEDAHLGIGDIYQASGDIDEAIKAYCDAITINPKNPKSYNKCALALWQKDYLEEAIVAYNKAIGLDPEYAIAYNNLGVIYLDGITNLKEARKLFNEAIRLDDKYAMAYFNLGRVEQEAGNDVAAAINYQKALDFNSIKYELEEDEIREKLHSLFEV